MLGYTAGGSLNDALASGALVGNAERAMAQAGGVRTRRAPKASRAPSNEAVVAPRPRIESGMITVKGALSEELVRRLLGRHLGRLQPCYQRQLAMNPSLKGTITLQIEVSASGRVANLTLVRSTLKHTWLEQCILNMAKRWVFPAPEGGGKVVITVPIRLKPTSDKPSAKGPSR